MSTRDLDGVEQLTKIKILCSRIFKDQKDFESIKELQKVLNNTRPTIVKTLEPIIFSVFFPMLKSISESSTKLSCNTFLQSFL